MEKHGPKQIVKGCMAISVVSEVVEKVIAQRYCSMHFAVYYTAVSAISRVVELVECEK